MQVDEFKVSKTRPSLVFNMFLTCSHVLPRVVPPFLIEQFRVTIQSMFTISLLASSQSGDKDSVLYISHPKLLADKTPVTK